MEIRNGRMESVWLWSTFNFLTVTMNDDEARFTSRLRGNLRSSDRWWNRFHNRTITEEKDRKCILLDGIPSRVLRAPDTPLTLTMEDVTFCITWNIWEGALNAAELCGMDERSGVEWLFCSANVAELNRRETSQHCFPRLYAHGIAIREETKERAPLLKENRTTGWREIWETTGLK